MFEVWEEGVEGGKRIVTGFAKVKFFEVVEV